ncbi:hypothetical protein ACWC5F_09970 [Streptomyces sp. NPDC001272]|uniref:hypothetical protein n=1 Tax=Streptomyces sp. NPDC001674 TaxID=3154394 RepID=UPI0033296567
MLRPILRCAAATAVTVVLAVSTAACDSAHRPASAAVPAATASAASVSDAGPADPGTQPERVRDAFAGLQATLNDSCTPANCAYFLGRVHDELHRMDRAMKADPQGPAHFPEPIALIAGLDRELGADHGFENLKQHQPALLATRDQINIWMQDHPEDYR